MVKASAKVQPAKPAKEVVNGGEVKKAGRKRAAPARAPPAAKKAKLDFRLLALSANDASSGGVMLALGQGDTGQLGLGEDVLDRKKPALIKDLEGVVDVCAGGMHTLCLTKEGVVYSFGCNDEGALGRITEDDEECFTPGKVDIPGKVVQICAGDSHSAAMTEDGKAYYWGTFRDSSGSFGLTLRGIEKTPVPLAQHLELKKIASGRQ
jgi:regulator of chromosome condensation